MLRIAGKRVRCCLLAPIILLTAGCAESEGKADEAHAAAFAAQFENGFEGHGAETASEIPGGYIPPERFSDEPDGIPFNRSASRTRQAEATVADNLTENFSLRFIMADPAAFVRSGEVRGVYQRELTSRNLPGDTVAGASALMFAVAWELANGGKLSQSQNAAILRQANEATRDNPLARQGDDAQQLQADIGLTVAGLWLEEARLRARFPDQMQELSDAVRRDMMKLSGTDMRKREVGDEGLIDLNQASAR